MLMGAADQSSDGARCDRRLFVGGLHHDVMELEIKKRFRPFGEVGCITLKTRRDETGHPMKTFAYVDLCATEGQVRKCISVLNCSEWKNNSLQVELAKESFLQRLARERANGDHSSKFKVALRESSNGLSQVLESPQGAETRTFHRKEVVLGTDVPDTKHMMKSEPSKFCHNLKHLPDVPGSPPISQLTWNLQDTNVPRVNSVAIGKEGESRIIGSAREDYGGSPRKRATRRVRETCLGQKIIVQAEKRQKRPSADSDADSLEELERWVTDEQWGKRGNGEQLQVVASNFVSKTTKHENEYEDSSDVEDIVQMMQVAKQNTNDSFGPCANIKMKSQSGSWKSKGKKQGIDLAPPSKHEIVFGNEQQIVTTENNEYNRTCENDDIGKGKAFKGRNKGDVSVARKVKTVAKRKGKCVIEEEEEEEGKKRIHHKYLEENKLESRRVEYVCEVNNEVDMVELSKFENAEKFEEGGSEITTTTSSEGSDDDSEDDGGAIIEIVQRRQKARCGVGQKVDVPPISGTSVLLGQIGGALACQRLRTSFDSRGEEVTSSSQICVDPKSRQNAADEGNRRRLDALEEHRRMAEARKKLVRGALDFQDRMTRHHPSHIIFDTSEVDGDAQDGSEQLETSEEECRKAGKLFDSEDDDDERFEGEAKNIRSDGDYFDCFQVKPQFEGKKGHKLLELQARRAADPRFRIDSRFLEDGGKDDEDEEENVGMLVGNDQVQSSKLERQTPPSLWAASKRVFRDTSTLHFDPLQEGHGQFEMKNQAKKKRLDPCTDVELLGEKPCPEYRTQTLPCVSSETFYNVSADLEQLFTSEVGGRTVRILSDHLEEEGWKNEEENAMVDEEEDGAVAEVLSRQDDHNGGTFKFSFFDSESMSNTRADMNCTTSRVRKSARSRSHHHELHSSSSDDDCGDVQKLQAADNGMTAVQCFSSRQTGMVTKPPFFFFANDPRLQEGPDLFCRKATPQRVDGEWQELVVTLREHSRKQRREAIRHTRTRPQ
uniref:nucleolar protein 8 n=1 Tax=Myxine glutinosa TaxID=7769 RepID=UPI00358F9664